MDSLPPLALPGPPLSREEAHRYSRQVRLPGIGDDGQRRLKNARVLVVGAGGLGSPVLQYLAAAGVGTLGVVDFDEVDLSNLQRQVIHRTADVGTAKTASAARGIRDLNPGIRVVQHAERLTRETALALFDGYDLVVDATDNFPTRYLVSDAAELCGIPVVWGSVYRFDGQVSVFWATAPDGRGVTYRDLFAEPPAPDTVLSCAEAGVFGAVCASVGAVMATEVLKLLIGIGEPLLGRVLILDALDGSRREIAVRARADRAPVTELVDYEELCGVPAADTDAPAVSVAELRTRLAAREQGDELFVLVDVREPAEHEAAAIPGGVLLPQAQLLGDPGAVPGEAETPVVVYCATGPRSVVAADALRRAGRNAVHLRGGIDAWAVEAAPVGA